MTKQLRLTVLSSALILAFNSAHAQENTNVHSLGEVTVEGSQGGVNYVVNSQQINKLQAETPAQFLRLIPGVQAGHSTALGQRLSIRGIPDVFANITIDGARQEGFHFHHSGNYGLDTEMLKQVGVDVGTNSITNDAGALVGSIKFETVDAADLLRPDQLWGARIKTGFHTNGHEWRNSLSTYGKAGPLDLLAYGSINKLKDKKMGGHGGGGRGRPNKIPNDGHDFSYLFKAKYNLTEDMYLNLSSQRYRSSAQTPTRINFLPYFDNEDDNGFRVQPLSNSAMDRKTHILTYGFAPVDNKLIDFRLEGYYNQQDSFHMRALSEPGESGFDTRIISTGAKLRNTSLFDTGEVNHRLITGFEYMDFKSKYQSDDPGESFFKSRKDVEHAKVYAFYVEDAIKIAQFTVTPGLRWDHVALDTHRPISEGRATVGAEPFSRSYRRLSKALAMNYEFVPEFNTFANYTELFRGPYGKELGLGIADNSPNLQATRGNNYEIGFRGNARNLWLAEDALGYIIKGFYTEYKNFTSGRNYSNIPKSRLEGFEVGMNYDNEYFGAGLAYSQVKNKIKKSDPTLGWYKGSEFQPSIGNNLILSLRYKVPQYGVEMGWNSRFFNKSNSTHMSNNRSGVKESNSIHKGGYGVSDLYLAWQPDFDGLQGLSVNFGSDNIFDKRYVDHSYYLTDTAGSAEAGRNFKLSLAYQF